MIEIIKHSRQVSNGLEVYYVCALWSLEIKPGRFARSYRERCVYSLNGIEIATAERDNHSKISEVKFCEGRIASCTHDCEKTLWAESLEKARRRPDAPWRLSRWEGDMMKSLGTFAERTSMTSWVKRHLAK